MSTERLLHQEFVFKTVLWSARTMVSAFFMPLNLVGVCGDNLDFNQEARLIKENRTTRINRMIRVPKVLVVDEDGTQLGTLDTVDALRIAEEKGLDLVEVASNARPPVCRIMDYGKFKYEASKKARKARQASHTVKVKTIQFRPKTDTNDYNTKKKMILKFLDAGNKVKIVMRFRGREISHLDLGLAFLNKLIEEVDEFGTPESRPQREGRLMTFVLAPKKV